MDDPIYIPMLRAKAGEIDAIGRLAPATQGLVCPMLDFPKQKPEDGRSLASYLGEKIHEITKSWGTVNKIFFDFSRYEPDVEVAGGQHIVDYVFGIARQSRLKPIPVVGPVSMRGPGTHYFEAVSRVATRDGRGVAVRVPYEDFVTPKGLERVLKETLDLVSIEPASADVLLDAGSLALVPPESRDDLVFAEILRTAATTVQASGYRRVVCTASNFPDSMVRHVKGDVLRVPRIEFRVWRLLIRDPKFKFLRYGDYGVIHPAQVESGARVIPPSRVRITTDDEYVLYKGSRDEIRAVSAAALRGGDLDGRISWGASAVRECAEGFGSSGSPADWVARDTNMHIENTVATIIRNAPAVVSSASPVGAAEGLPWLQNPLGLAHSR